MQVQELKRLLERFPQTAEIEIETPDKRVLDLGRLEMAFNQDPIPMGSQGNLSWADMVSERIKARIVATPIVREALAAERG